MAVCLNETNPRPAIFFFLFQGHNVNIKRDDITAQGMILRVSKEGMKSYENNHVVSARVSAHSGGGVPWHVHWLTPPRPPQVGDLYITFDVKFPSGGLSDSAKEGRLLRLRLHSLCISSKQCTPLSIHRCQYTAVNTPRPTRRLDLNRRRFSPVRHRDPQDPGAVARSQRLQRSRGAVCALLERHPSLLSCSLPPPSL